MKVRSFRARRVAVETVAQCRALLRSCGRTFLGTKGIALAAIIFAVASAFLIWPHDMAWLSAVHIWRGASEATAHRVAWYLGTFGDYPTYNLPFALLVWSYGVVTRSSAWRRVAVIAFMGATLAGLFDDCFRLTLGRPRPDMLSHAGVSDGFHGPAYAFRGGFQSFPSGHAASTVGMAVALLMTEFPLGVLTAIIACGVVWGRLELGKHYPSDVLVGSTVGLYFGWLVGRAAQSRAPASS